MVWSLEALIMETINPITKSKSKNGPCVNTGKRTIRVMSGSLPRGTDPKSQKIFSKTPRIVARFGRFLWLSEYLVLF
jgi:hypothetical protein